MLVGILALANLGTSFASAILAKDTTTNKENELVNKGTGEAVATAEAQATYEVNEPPNSRARSLCTAGGEDEFDCEVTASSFTEISATSALALLDNCSPPHVKTVNLVFNWISGQQSSRTICHPSWSCESVFTKVQGTEVEGKLCLQGTDEFVHIKENDSDDTKYTISVTNADLEVQAADALTSDSGEQCYSNEDCDTGLVCGVLGNSEPAIADSSIPVPATPCNVEGDHKVCGGDFIACVPASTTFLEAQAAQEDGGAKYDGVCSVCDFGDNTVSIQVVGEVTPPPSNQACSDPKHPVCVKDSSEGTGRCGCNVNSDCPLGQSCGVPDCVGLGERYCSANHNFDWGCTVCQEQTVTIATRPVA